MRHNGLRVALLTLLLSAVWYVLSGRFDLLHFGAGVVVALIIALNARPIDDDTTFHPLRFALYIPWLAVQIVLSNLRVARAVLSREMPISPRFLTREPGVKGDHALATLAASITLTPGTLTVDVGPDEIFVHALDTLSARDVRAGVIPNRLGRVFEPAGSEDPAGPAEPAEPAEPSGPTS